MAIIIYRPRQLAGPDGTPSGRWHITRESNEDGSVAALCDCPDAHESPEAARLCPQAAAVLAQEFPPAPPNQPTLPAPPGQPITLELTKLEACVLEGMLASATEWPYAFEGDILAIARGVLGRLSGMIDAQSPPDPALERALDAATIRVPLSRDPT